jgi:hemerythrin
MEDRQNMSLFEWNDEFDVGIAEIDADHRDLFRTAEELHEGILNGTAEDDLEVTYSRLAEQTRAHFEREDAILRKQGHPNVEQISREHLRLTQKVEALGRRIEKRQARLDMETLRFLRTWLDHHIRDTK